MRAAFFGSPDFAVPCLSALAEMPGVTVPVVISQPDRPAGRGLTLRPPAVKVRAQELGLDVWQPTKVRTGDLAERLAALQLDVAVVVAYGRILPKTVLDAPRLGCVNVHGSILPRWRGAAPIQWAVASGDKETGVTLMQMDEGMDTGDILSIERLPIGPQDTGGDVFAKLAPMGAELLQRDLPRFVSGELKGVTQDHAAATHARMLTKQDGALDWSNTAQQIHDHARGMRPWPGSFTTVAVGDKVGARVKVHATTPLTLTHDTRPGTVLGGDREGVRVACGRGVLALTELQLPGRKRVTAEQFVAGRGFSPGTVLGFPESTEATNALVTADTKSR